MDHAKAVADFLSTPFRDAHKCVDKIWFYWDDDYWIVDAGMLRIQRAIAANNRDLDWRQGGMQYMIDRMRRELAVRLQTDKFPGHVEVSPVPDYLNS